MQTAVMPMPVQAPKKSTATSTSKFYVFVEEADTVLGEDMKHWLNRGRKRGVPLILMTTHLSRFQDRFTDAEDAALSQPGVHISFQTKGGRDLEKLALIHGIGSLDFTKNMIPMDRPDGHEVLIVPDRSFNRSRSKSKTKGKNRSTSTIEGNVAGESASDGSSDFTSQGLHTQKGKSKNKGKVQSSSKSLAHSFVDGEMEQDSFSESEGETISLRHQFLQKHREEWYSHGLETSVQDQLWKTQKLLRVLGVAQCVITVGHTTSLVQVTHIPHPFKELPKTEKFVLDRATQQMWQHKFFFQPGEVKCHENKRFKKRPGTNDSSNS